MIWFCIENHCLSLSLKNTSPSTSVSVSTISLLYLDKILQMENTINQTHGTSAYLYALSKMFERASYYGVRGLLVLYMIGAIFAMTETDALMIYGWFVASFAFSKVLGAILGDLVIGNKKAIIWGGFIQAMGAFSFCIPSTAGLYTGLFLTVLGGGLYAPNLTAQFGKQYLKKTKLLDAGFSMYYIAINIGSFFSTVLIAYLKQNFGWNAAFIAAGVMMLLSIIYPLLTKENNAADIEALANNTVSIEKEESGFNRNQKIRHILMALVLVGLFWAVHSIATVDLYTLELQFREISNLGILESGWVYISSIMALPISLLAIIFWTRRYSTQVFKLTVGFILGAISFGILCLIPEVLAIPHIALYLLSFFFLSIAEVYIAPVIHSTLTKYINPKYLAIAISLAFLPSRLFIFLFSFFDDYFFDIPSGGALFGTVLLGAVSIGLTLFILRQKGKI